MSPSVRFTSRRNSASRSASAQVFAEDDGRTRFVWIADVLPNEIAPYMDAQMDLGTQAMQKALGRDAA